MRYKITTEKTPGTPKQHCVYDIMEDRVIARFAKEADAQAVIDRYLLHTPVEE